METLNSLERLNLLEKKIVSLVDALKTEIDLNLRLTKENKELCARLDSVETSLLKGSQSIEELSQEKALTKEVVDELIRHIDQLVEVRQEER